MSKSFVIDAIAHIRREWQETAEDSSLVDTKGSIDLFLADITQAMNFTSEETQQALGSDLYEELRDIFCPVL